MGWHEFMLTSIYICKQKGWSVLAFGGTQIAGKGEAGF